MPNRPFLLLSLTVCFLLLIVSTPAFAGAADPDLATRPAAESLANIKVIRWVMSAPAYWKDGQTLAVPVSTTILNQSQTRSGWFKLSALLSEGNAAPQRVLPFATSAQPRARHQYSDPLAPMQQVTFDGELLLDRAAVAQFQRPIKLHLLADSCAEEGDAALTAVCRVVESNEQDNLSWPLSLTVPPQAAGDTTPAAGDTTGPAAIDFLRLSHDEARPGDVVTVEWQVRNAEQIMLVRSNGVGRLVDRDILTLGPGQRGVESGSIDWVVTNLRYPQNESTFELVVEGGGASAAQGISLTHICDTDWFYGPSTTGPCPGQQQNVPIVQQQFEHGWLVQLGSMVAGDLVWVLHNGNVEELALPATAAVSTPTPPAGLMAPSGRLGQLWQQEPGLRDRLGWAVGPATTTTTTMQTAEWTDLLNLFADTQWQAADGDIFVVHQVNMRDEAYDRFTP